MGKILVGNAPEHWPPLDVSILMPEETPSRQAANRIAIGGAFASWKNDSVKLKSLPHKRLLPGGVHDIHFMVNDNDRPVYVYYYVESDAPSAAHFAGLQNPHKQLKLETPVYYAPTILPETSETANPLIPFDFTMLSTHHPTTSVEYAMWWKTEDDPKFAHSEAFQHLDRFFKAIDGYESYLLPEILVNLEAIELEEPTRVALPNNSWAIEAQGPEGIYLMFLADREKGIRFAFDRKKTTPQLRNLFFKHLADYAEEIQGELSKMDAPKDPHEDTHPHKWWLMNKRSAKENDVMAFGIAWGSPEEGDQNSQSEGPEKNGGTSQRRHSFIGLSLLVIAFLICWLPILGPMCALPAVWLNRKSGKIIVALSGLVLLLTLVLTVVFFQTQGS